MRRIRIAHTGELASGLTVMLNPNASHHLLQVLRKKAGERFIIFNGNGGEFNAQLISTNKKTACVEIGEFHERHTESALKIHLGQAISRGERMDYAIQKSVELGVTEITPLITEFGQVQLADNRVEKRVAHWQAIAVSSAEQSGRCIVPLVNEPILFSEWIKQSCALKLICCPRTGSNAILPANAAPRDTALTIGAEGGFSDREVQAALQAGYIAFPLGPRILRTETATVVALTLLQHQLGDIN